MWLNRTGMMAHYKTEAWLNRTGQVAQSPQDYSGPFPKLDDLNRLLPWSNELPEGFRTKKKK